MRKALIYLSAFCVSFLTIYSVYYYSKVFKLQQALVVKADELKHTFIGPGHAAFVTEGNAIYLPGLLQAMHYNDTANSGVFGGNGKNIIPDINYLGGQGKYGKTFVVSLNDEVVKKYTNHPPIDFENVKVGDSIVFSYLFKRVLLPKGFFWSNKALSFNGKPVRSLLYKALPGINSGVKYYSDPSTNQKALVVPLQDSQEAVYYYSGKGDNVVSKYADAGQFLKSTAEQKLADNEAVQLPDLDFYIQKDYKTAELLRDGLALGGKKLVEERIKFKTNAPVEEPADFDGKRLAFGGPTLFYLRNVRDSLPYIAILIRDPELLISQKK